MPDSTPVWIWLPGATEPVQAATLSSAGRHHGSQYDPAYLAGTGPALDLVQLRLKPAVITTP